MAAATMATTTKNKSADDHDDASGPDEGDDNKNNYLYNFDMAAISNWPAYSFLNKQTKLKFNVSGRRFFIFQSISYITSHFHFL